MLDKVLIIIRGVQGSGKSTLARMIRNAITPLDEQGTTQPFPHYEADMFFIDPETGVYSWDSSKIGQAHRWCQWKVNGAMEAGEPTIIVSNTFVKKEEMQPYVEMAEQHGYVVQEIICKGRFKNVHSVSEEKVEAKRKAFEY